jgi:hypothetical protein
MYDINTPLPDADYLGPIFGPDFVPAERETFAEALDRKCSETEYQNSWYRNA